MHRHPLDFLNGIVLIFWLTFYLYWAVSAAGVKQDVPGKGSRRGWILSRIGLLVVLVAVYRLPASSPFWEYAARRSFFRYEAVRIVGTILTFLGIAFAVWARGYLGRNWSPRPTMKIGHELITSGPYSLVRHPIYTGLLAGLFGTGLAIGPVCMVVFVVFTIVFVRRIRVEEAYMMEMFPDAYPAYCAKTKALIPAVW